MRFSMIKSAWLWKALLAGWLLFSIVYVAHDQWKTFTTTRIEAAKLEGKTEIVNEILGRAKSCEPFPVYNGDHRVNIIDIDCLRRGPGPGSDEVLPTPPADAGSRDLRQPRRR